MTNNNFFNELANLPNFALDRTNGQVTITLLSKDRLETKDNWKSLYKKIKADHQALQTLLLFCLMPIIADSPSSLIIDKKEHFKNYFDDKHPLSQLIKYTDFTLTPLSSLACNSNIIRTNFSKINFDSSEHNLSHYLYLGFNQQYSDNVTREYSALDYITPSLTENSINIILEHPIEAQYILSMLSAEDIFYFFENAPNFEIWIKLKELHEKNYTEQYKNIENLNSILFVNIKNKFDKYQHEAHSDYIIKIFQFLEYIGDTELFEKANISLQDYCEKHQIKAFDTLFKLEKIISNENLKYLYKYEAFEQIKQPLVLNLQENLLEINALKIVINIPNNYNYRKCKNVRSLETHLVNNLNTLLTSENSKNIPFLNSITIFSSLQSDSFIIYIKPSYELSKDKIVEMTIQYLTTYVNDVLFSDRPLKIDQYMAFFENQQLQHLIPFNSPNTTKTKFLKF